MRISILPVALAMLLIQSVSYAMHHAEDSSTKGSDKAGVYVGASAGIAFLGEGAEPFFGKGYLGFSDGVIGFEVGYFETAMGRSTETTAWAKTRGGDLAIVLKPFQHSSSPLVESFFLRAGGHYSEVKSGYKYYFWGGPYDITDNYNGIGYLAGAGFDLPVNDTLTARLGYNFYGSLGGRGGQDYSAVSAGIQLNF